MWGGHVHHPSPPRDDATGRGTCVNLQAERTGEWQFAQWNIAIIGVYAWGSRCPGEGVLNMRTASEPTRDSVANQVRSLTTVTACAAPPGICINAASD